MKRILSLTLLAAIAPGAALADALPYPAMEGPLTANADPWSVDMGPLGKIHFGGAISGLALTQDNPAPGDRHALADLGNAQLFIAKTDGWFQVFVQAGGYSLPALGTAYVRFNNLTDHTYQWVPQGFVKLVPADNVSVQIGKLPTLVGAEYTFTFENMNIERGLLWNQEPAVSRGVQANYSSGPVNISASWNDGYYSNRYNWLSGSAAYTIDARNTVSVVAAGNIGRTDYSTFAAPYLQNNGAIFNLIYTYNAAPWLVNPYVQYSTVPRDAALGIPTSGATFGAGLLANYGFTPMFNLSGRVEYETSSGKLPLLYGPGSDAWSFTLTPTLQLEKFFVRADAAYAGLGGASQTRVLLEAGVLY